jgi:uncharacterized protein (DUF2267 family)
LFAPGHEPRPAAGRFHHGLAVAAARHAPAASAKTQEWEGAMAATGLEVFDRTLQATHIWLDEIMARLGPDRQLAWRALGAVLHALRDRVPVTLAAHVGAQLPLLVRGLYYDQWRPEARPEKARRLEDFLEMVGAGLEGARPVDRREAAQAVFRVMSHHMDPGQVGKLVQALPGPVQELWTEVAAVELPPAAANDKAGAAGGDSSAA